jgi:hypothetical protein
LVAGAIIASSARVFHAGADADPAGAGYILICWLVDLADGVIAAATVVVRVANRPPALAKSATASGRICCPDRPVLSGEEQVGFPE